MTEKKDSIIHTEYLMVEYSLLSLLLLFQFFKKKKEIKSRLYMYSSVMIFSLT